MSKYYKFRTATNDDKSIGKTCGNCLWQRRYRGDNYCELQGFNEPIADLYGYRCDRFAMAKQGK